MGLKGILISSIFVCTLIFALLATVGIASAYLSVVAVYGGNSINGYRAANDSILVNVSSDSNVSMNGGVCALFPNSNTTYYCGISDVASSATALYQLTNDNGEHAIASIHVDNSIGAINYNITINNATATLSYTAQDTGFNGNSACSGLSELDVYDGSTNINTIPLNGTPGNCLYTGEVNLTLLQSGEHEITLVVNDSVGNIRSTVPKNISIDIVPPQINNGMTITYSGTSSQITTISNNANYVVDIEFSIIEDNLSSITADLSSFDTNPAINYGYKNFNVPLSDCVYNITDTTYDCIVHSIPMHIAGGSVNATITAIDTAGNTATSTISQSFQVDNQVPQATMQTGLCDKSGRCYVKNGVNTIIINLNKQDFSMMNVFFTVDGSAFPVNRVQNCTSSTCTANISITCNDGPISVSIASPAIYPSMDDARNPISAYSTIFYCDNTPPVILNTTYAGDSTSPIKSVISGDTVTITATAYDAQSTSLSAMAFTDKLTNSTLDGTCNSNGNNSTFNCIWVITNINAGYYKANVVLNISDDANNTITKILTFDVLGNISGNATPNNLGITLNSVTPDTIDRAVLGMSYSQNLPFYLYADYSVNAVRGKDVDVLFQDVDISKCSYITSNGTTPASFAFQSARITNPNADISQDNMVELVFAQVDPNMLNDNFVIACNISARVQVGKNVYTNPQMLELDIPLHMINAKLCKVGTDWSSCTPGQVFASKIDDLQNSWITQSNILSTLNTWIPKLQQVCRLGDYIAGGTFASGVVAQALNGVSFIINPGGNSLAGPAISIHKDLSSLYSDLTCGNGVSSAFTNLDLTYTNGPISTSNGNAVSQPPITQLSKQATQSVNSAKCTGIVAQACSYLTCTNVISKSSDSNISNKIPDIFGGYGFFTETAAAISKNANVPDVSNSIVAAVSQECYPAIVYNINKWRETDCNYLYCLKLASYTGSDISVCDKARYAQTCSIVVGEVFELPYARLLKNYMQNAADYINNFLPLAVSSAAKNAFCSEYLNFNTGTESVPLTTPVAQSKIVLCQIPLQIARFADMNARSQRSAQFNYPAVPDMCQYAQCVGQANCAYTPNFWDTLANMNLPTPQNRTMDYTQFSYIALQNQNQEDLRTLEANNPGTSSFKSAKTRLIEGEVLQTTDFDTDNGMVNTKTINDKIDSINNAKSSCNGGGDCTKQSQANNNMQAPMTTPQAQADYDSNLIKNYNSLKQLNAAQPSTYSTPNEQKYYNMQKINLYRTTCPSCLKIVDTCKDKQQCETIGDTSYVLTSNLSSKYIENQLSNLTTEMNNLQGLATAQRVGNTMQMFLQYLNANKMLNWMFTKYWTTQWFGIDLSAYFDFNQLTDSVCNPGNPINPGSSSPGYVISCTSGSCQQVLTFSAARTELQNYTNDSSGSLVDNSYYIYSTTYYIQPGDMRGFNVNYNVQFKGNGPNGLVTLQGWGVDQAINPFTMIIKHLVFISTVHYDQICMEFTNPGFPPQDSLRRGKEFCRPITSEIFQSGSPYTPNIPNNVPNVDNTGKVSNPGYYSPNANVNNQNNNPPAFGPFDGQ